MVCHSGIGTYIRGIAEALARRGQRGAVPPLPEVRFLGPPGLLSAHPFFALLGGMEPLELPLYGPREQFLFPRQSDASLLHFPHYNVPQRLGGVPFVTTIHDLIHLLMPEVLGSRVKWMVSRTILRSAVSRARLIITVSEFSRDDLVRHLGVAPERIVVTPNAVSDSFVPVGPGQVEETRKRLGLTGPFLLAVGVNKPHKNFPFLVRAFSRWRRGRQSPQVSLAVCGMKPEDETSLAGLARENDADGIVRFVRYLPHEELPALYQAADALVFPSLYEGFGIPTLEAQRLGTPVISSNATSLPEVGGDGALYFDPRSEAELAACLDRHYADPAGVKARVEAGRINEKRYSWDATAALTLDAYGKALGF